MIEKRSFLAGRICATQGWFERTLPREPLTPWLEWQFYTGHEVQTRAQSFLGDGLRLPRTPLGDAITKSLEAITGGQSPLLYEVSFKWKGFVARADALRRLADGWEAIEVKSGKSPAPGEAPKEEYLDDLAYTAMVAIQSQIPLVRASLVLINRDYRLDGPAPVLALVDVTAEVLKRAAVFAEMAPPIEAALLAEASPTPSLQFVCGDCSHYTLRCVGQAVSDPLFALPRLSPKAFGKLREYGRIGNLPADAPLTAPQQRVASVIRANAPIIEEGLSALSEFVWPAHYLDFEAVGPAFPWFQGSPPYDAEPFQYSLDIAATPTDEGTHREYLAPHAGDWRRELTERLLADLGTLGSIVVYSSYEKTMLNGLGALFPDLKAQIDAAVARLFDLERVFRNGYIHPEFKGRTSIKAVLPVMVPGEGYADLAIRGGADATAVFALMRVGKYSAASHAQHRKDLLKYCGRDTRALLLLHREVIALAP